MKPKILITTIIVFIIIVFFSKDSIGKYFSKTNIEVGADIVKPILNVEGELTLEIDTAKEKEIYNFKVKNYDKANNVTEVELEYYIEIFSKENNNIKLKIYKEDRELNVFENKTEKFLLNKEQKQEDDYKIEILFSDISAQEIMQEIEIKVYSEQKNK